MRKKEEKKKYQGRKLITYETILSAKECNSEAMGKIIDYYKPYIRQLSIVNLYDASGNTYLYVDQEKMNLLQMKLISATIKFDIE